MKSLSDFSEIYLHRLPVDGRKQINGLSLIAQGCMGISPCSGALFVFTNRNRDTVRLLYWDRTGFALWVKRLEAERFRWPIKFEKDVLTLSSQQLAWLLDGIDIFRIKPHATLSFSAVS